MCFNRNHSFHSSGECQSSPAGPLSQLRGPYGCPPLQWGWSVLSQPPVVSVDKQNSSVTIAPLWLLHCFHGLPSALAPLVAERRIQPSADSSKP